MDKEIIFWVCTKNNLSPKLRKIKKLGYKIKRIIGPNIENKMFIEVYPEINKQLELKI